MSRRNPNQHTIVRGAFKSHKPGTPSRTKASRARIYFAYPLVGGWAGGDPALNGWRPKVSR